MVERFEGIDARFGTAPDEIYVVLQAGRPAYVRLRPGEFLQEGDSFHREQLGLSSPTLETWEVTTIADDEVAGEVLDTREPVAWDREHVERGLAIGEYSTNLTDFEAVSVVQTGRWRDFGGSGGGGDDGSDDGDGSGDGDGDGSGDGDAGSDDGGGYRYTDRPYVTVIAYGDNGLKYGRRYEFAGDEGSQLELWTQDEAIEGFADSVAERFERRVRAALAADGYAVRDADG